MSKQQIVVTDEGLKKLTEELEYLKNIKRKEVVESIRTALSFGDLSENSEYDEAKNEQAKVESQINELEETLKHVKVISDEDISTEIVNIGAKIKVLDVGYNEELEYTIVGSTEANPIENKISDQSPIGSSLLGARVGDIVTAETPGGDLKLQILSISK